MNEATYNNFKSAINHISLNKDRIFTELDEVIKDSIDTKSVKTALEATIQYQKMLSHLEDEIIEDIDHTKSLLSHDRYDKFYQGELFGKLMIIEDITPLLSPEFYDNLNEYKKYSAESINNFSGPHWISVDERLPEDGPNDITYCIVRDANGDMGIGFYRDDAKAWDSDNFGWLERDPEESKNYIGPKYLDKIVEWMPAPDGHVKEGD